MGDGLLTIDGDFHRRSRLIMLPAFHRERIAASVDVMVAGDRTARSTSSPPASASTSTPGRAVSPCGSRCARCSASTPTAPPRASIDAAGLFEQALSFYSSDYALRMLRGPFTPWDRLQQAARALDQLIYSEISRRRASGERGEDMLSLLLDAATRTAPRSATCRSATR